MDVAPLTDAQPSGDDGPAPLTDARATASPTPGHRWRRALAGARLRTPRRRRCISARSFSRRWCSAAAGDATEDDARRARVQHVGPRRARRGGGGRPRRGRRRHPGPRRGGAPGPGVRIGLAVLLAIAMSWARTPSRTSICTDRFSGEVANRAFSLYLSLLLAVPQGWWKSRHLAHHQSPAGRRLAVRAACFDGARGAGRLLGAVALFAAAAPALFADVSCPPSPWVRALCHPGPSGAPPAARPVSMCVRRSTTGCGSTTAFHAAHHRFPDGALDHAARALPRRTMREHPAPDAGWLERAPALTKRGRRASSTRWNGAALRLPPARRYLLATHAPGWSACSASPVDTAAIREITIIGWRSLPAHGTRARPLAPGRAPHARGCRARAP